MKNVSESKIAVVVLCWFMLCFSIIALCSCQEQQPAKRFVFKDVRHIEFSNKHLAQKIKQHQEHHLNKQKKLKTERKQPIIVTLIAFNY